MNYEVYLRKHLKINIRIVIILYKFCFLYSINYLMSKHVFIFNVVNMPWFVCRFLYLEMGEVKNMRPSWLLVNMKAWGEAIGLCNLIFWKFIYVKYLTLNSIFLTTECNMHANLLMHIIEMLSILLRSSKKSRLWSI